MLGTVVSHVETINRDGSYLSHTENKYLQTLHYNLWKKNDPQNKRKGDKGQLPCYLGRLKHQLHICKPPVYEVSKVRI